MMMILSEQTVAHLKHTAYTVDEDYGKRTIKRTPSYAHLPEKKSRDRTCALSQAQLGTIRHD